jgi:hypothetical protein
VRAHTNCPECLIRPRMASDSQARHRDLNSDPAVIEL